MTATIAIAELIGYVILLLWGTRMVQSGVVRAFGIKPASCDRPDAA